jgi:tetratricopeptide (TPR) repeat protein
MRWPVWGMLAAALTCVAPARAQSPAYVEKCVRGQSADERLDGCTTAIRSGRYKGKDLAWAFNNRGAAYYYKRDYDRAVADYEEAIRLDPKSAAGYTGRGYAWQAKGDYDRAFADYDEAIRLDPKYATAYQDRGSAWESKGEYDRAIADYDEAIRLDPKHAKTYQDRGNAWRAKGEFDRAIADYDEAIRLDPKSVQAQLSSQYALTYTSRGGAWLAKGDFDRAITDYDAAMRLDPKNAAAYFGRGRANLYAGALPKALADLNQASELNRKSAYTALWLDIVNKRSNVSSRLADATQQIDMTKWPAPVIRLFLGQFTPEALLAAADDPKAETKKGQVCEANFYTAELALQQGNKDEAKRLFALAAADCPRTFIEYEGAMAELKALGESR